MSGIFFWKYLMVYIFKHFHLIQYAVFIINVNQFPLQHKLVIQKGCISLLRGLMRRSEVIMKMDLRLQVLV